MSSMPENELLIPTADVLSLSKVHVRKLPHFILISCFKGSRRESEKELQLWSTTLEEEQACTIAVWVPVWGSSIAAGLTPTTMLGLFHHAAPHHAGAVQIILIPFGELRALGSRQVSDCWGPWGATEHTEVSPIMWFSTARGWDCPQYFRALESRTP